jgi:hypothetical protein
MRERFFHPVQKFFFVEIKTRKRKKIKFELVHLKICLSLQSQFFHLVLVEWVREFDFIPFSLGSRQSKWTADNKILCIWQQFALGKKILLALWCPRNFFRSIGRGRDWQTLWIFRAFYAFLGGFKIFKFLKSKSFEILKFELKKPLNF